MKKVTALLLALVMAFSLIVVPVSADDGDSFPVNVNLSSGNRFSEADDPTLSWDENGAVSMNETSALSYRLPVQIPQGALVTISVTGEATSTIRMYLIDKYGNDNNKTNVITVSSGNGDSFTNKVFQFTADDACGGIMIKGPGGGKGTGTISQITITYVDTEPYCTPAANETAILNYSNGRIFENTDSGQTVALPSGMTFEIGETYKIRFVGSTDGDFRAWIGTNSDASNAWKASDNGYSFPCDFDVTTEFTVKDDAKDELLKSFAFKGPSYGVKTNNLVVKYVAIVGEEEETPDPGDDVVVDPDYALTIEMGPLDTYEHSALVDVSKGGSYSLSIDGINLECNGNLFIGLKSANCTTGKSTTTLLPDGTKVTITGVYFNGSDIPTALTQISDKVSGGKFDFAGGMRLTNFGINKFADELPDFITSIRMDIEVTLPEPEPETEYTTVLILVKDGTGLLTDNDFTTKAVYGDPGHVIRVSSNPDESELFLKAFSVPGARLVMKYTISGESGGWFNFIQTNTSFCVANWDGSKNKIFKNADGSAHGDTISIGDHEVYIDCAEYVSLYEQEKSESFYNNFKAFGFQSGISGTFYFTELTLEVPAGTNLDEIDIPGKSSGTITFYSEAVNPWDSAKFISGTNGIKYGNWNRICDITGLVENAAGTDISKVTDVTITVEVVDADSFPDRIGDYWDCVSLRAMYKGQSDPITISGRRANAQATTGTSVTMKQYLMNDLEGLFIHLEDYAPISADKPVTFKVTVGASVSETGPLPLTLNTYDDTRAAFALYTPVIVKDGYGETVLDKNTIPMNIDDFNKAINIPGAKLYIDELHSGWSGFYWFEFILPDGSTKNVEVDTSEVIGEVYNYVLTSDDLISLLKDAGTEVPDDYAVELKNVKRHAGDTTIKRFEVVVPIPELIARPIYTDKIALQFAIPSSVSNTASSMKFTIDGITTNADGEIGTTSDGECWFFTMPGIIPEQMADEIAYEVIVNDIVILSDTTTYQAYAENSMGNTENAEYIDFLKASLVYGAAVDAYLGNNHESLAGYISDYNPNSIEDWESVAKVTNGTEGFKWIGATLVFDETIEMRLYYSGTIDDVNNVVITRNGTAVTCTKGTSDNGTYIAITGFVPTDYTNEVVAKYKGSTVNYSVASYILKLQNDKVGGKLVHSLYDYAKAAIAYTSGK